MNPLEKYFLENKGWLIDKWTHYFEIYHRHFERFRGRPVTLLELGVYHGGSLRMWKDYLGPQSVIVGVDFNERCKKFEEDGIHVRVGRQEDRDFLAGIRKEFPKVDIIIDDAGHESDKVRISFEELYPHLDEDGVYLVEDLHASYWQHFGGGYRDPRSFIEFSKGLIDSLNAHYFEDGVHGPDEYTPTLAGIHFYDSVAIFDKRRPGKPPRRLVSGRLAFPAPEIAEVCEQSGSLVRPYEDRATEGPKVGWLRRLFSRRA